MDTTNISKNVSFTGHRSGRISQPMLTLFTGMVTEIKRLYALLDGKKRINRYTVGSCHPFPEAVRTLFRHEQEALHQSVGRSGQDGYPFRKLSQGLFPPAQRLSGGTCGNHARLLGRTALWRHILYHRKGADAEQNNYKPL